MRGAVVACIVAVVGVACVTAEGSFKDKGLTSAAFDLQCPAEQVQYTVLTKNDGLGCAGSKVGVRGCGKQTTYVCNEAQAWLRESEVQSAAPPAPPTAPPTDPPPAPTDPAPASGW